MKVRVDSGEFSNVVRSVGKYSRSLEKSVSGIILLMVRDGQLIVRATSGVEDCVINVNAFEPFEDGIAVTSTGILTSSSIDSGGLLSIEVDGEELLLDYGNAQMRIGIISHNEEDFPESFDIQPFPIDLEVLKIAAGSTTVFERSGHQIKSSIHIFPHNDSVAVMGTDGYVGFISHVECDIDKLISVDAQMLTKALSTIGNFYSIGVSGTHFSVNGDIGVVTFSSVACGSIENIVNGFYIPTDYGPYEISAEELNRIAVLCDSAKNVHPSSQIQIHGNDVTILGNGINIKSTLEGELPDVKSVFACSAFSRMFKRKFGNPSISIKMTPSGTSHFWYIDDSGYRYFVFSSQPVFFKE